MYKNLTPPANHATIIINKNRTPQRTQKRRLSMNYNCLIIDDETMLSENTRDYFNTLGVKTAWVADEKSCLDFFQNNTADLILLDVNLQDSSEFDLCLHLRKTISVPILFISVRRVVCEI